MKIQKFSSSCLLLVLSALVLLFSKPAEKIHLNGTWQLLTSTTATKGVSSITDYRSTQGMIKIFNDTHFAFLKHDLNPAKDSTNHFYAGGGTYALTGNKYVEHLDFYGDRNWEHKTFKFTLSMSKDTLIQKGVEKVEKEKIDRLIIERYLRLE